MAEYVNESGLVEGIRKAVVKKYPGAWIFKVHGGQMQMAGVPDILMCIDGLIIGAEAKHKKPGESETHARERATPGQIVQIQRINNAGGIAGVVLTPQETLDLIERGFQKHRDVWAARLAREKGDHDES
jgi:hypothetical protein